MIIPEYRQRAAAIEYVGSLQQAKKRAKLKKRNRITYFKYTGLLFAIGASIFSLLYSVSLF